MSVEDKKEEMSNSDGVVGLEVLSFVELLTKIVKRYSTTNDGFTLNAETIIIISKILESEPSYFSDVEKLFAEIVTDNKIDTNDIPKLIQLIQKLYELIYNLKDKKLNATKRCEICASILKFIIHNLVEEKKILIDDEHKIIFLSETDKLIDSFIGLIRLPKELKTPSCLQTLFGKK